MCKHNDHVASNEPSQITATGLSVTPQRAGDAAAQQCLPVNSKGYIEPRDPVPRRRSLRYRLQIESICLREFTRLLRRDSRYTAIVLGMYVNGLRATERARLLRASYCLARRFDDVLDGDCTVTEDPPAFVQRVLQEAESANPADAMPQLARFVQDGLTRYANGHEQPWPRFLELVDAMTFDYFRARDTCLLSEQALRCHWQQTFSCAMDISLCIAGANLRSNGLADLILAQGALYNLRDLKQDLSMGLINLPEQVVQKILLEGSEISYTSVIKSTAARQWMALECARADACLQRMTQRLATGVDPRAQKMVSWLHRDLTRLATRLTAVFQLPPQGH